MSNGFRYGDGLKWLMDACAALRPPHAWLTARTRAAA